jgi:hypothetical protein
VFLVHAELHRLTGEKQMFKALFKSTTADDHLEAEIEATMRNIHARMDRMLEREHMKNIRFGTAENTPSYYR